MVRQSGRLMVTLLLALSFGYALLFPPGNVANTGSGATLVFQDNFDDNQTNPAVWSTYVTGSGPLLAEVNQRLEITHPANSVSDPSQGKFAAAYHSLFILRGDFDIQVDYQLLTWPSANGVRIGLATALGLTERTSFGSSNDFPGYPREVYLTHFPDGVQGITATTDLSGKLRQVRTGSTIQGYYYNQGNWVMVHSAPATTGDVGVELSSWSQDNVFAHQEVKLAFDNFIVNSGQFLGGSISGKVTASDGTTPILGATVSIRTTASSTTVASATTVADGTYTVSGMATGQYFAYAAKTNYERKYYNNVNASYDAATISVTSPNNVANINFSLGPGGTISGTVRNADGSTPLASIHIEVKQSNWNGGRGAKSGTDGTWTVTNLPYGAYTIYAGRGETEGGDPRYIREYYNNKGINQVPDPVVVASGVNPTGIDFTLAIGGSISGKVTQQDGTTPIAGATVYAFFYNTWEWVNQITTAADGTYTLPGMPTGQFYIRASVSGRELRYYNNVSVSTDATAVSVTPPNNTPNINFSLGPGGSISGTVRNADGSAALATIRIAARQNGWSGDRTTASAGDGTYTINGVPYGSYTVWAGRGETEGGDSRYIREYFNNKAINQAPDTVIVTSGANPTGIDFTLAIGGSISGRVTQQDGTTPISGATVYAYIYNTGELVNNITTASDGTYSLPGIPSGQFWVAAGATGREWKYYNNVYTRADASTPIAVTPPGNVPNINLSLGPGGTISGTVRNADGSAALSRIHVETKQGAWTGARSAKTGFDGAYIINGVPFGSYTIWAGRGETEGGDSRYIREYYNNKALNQSPGAVTVASGANPAGIDFTLAIGGSISGKVTQQDGATPISGARVYAYIFGTWEWINDIAAAADGTYTLPGVPAGQTLVSASASGRETRYYNNVTVRDSGTAVIVTSGATVPNINFSLSPVSGVNKAEVAFTHDVDPNAYLGARISRFFDSATGQTVTLADGIGAFDVDMVYSAAGISIKGVTGLAPFASPTVGYNVDGGTRTLVVAFQTGSGPQPPTELFRLYPWLTGGKDTPYTVTLHFNAITRVGGAEVPQNADVTKTFLRGDAKADGAVTIADALFIAQYLAGMRGLGETTGLVNPVNAATPRNDSATMGSSITIADALFIAQMLAGLRDASYNPIP